MLPRTDGARLLTSGATGARSVVANGFKQAVCGGQGLADEIVPGLVVAGAGKYQQIRRRNGTAAGGARSVRRDGARVLASARACRRKSPASASRSRWSSPPATRPTGPGRPPSTRRRCPSTTISGTRRRRHGPSDSPRPATRRPPVTPSWPSWTATTRRCACSSVSPRCGSRSRTTDPGWLPGRSGSRSPPRPRASEAPVAGARDHDPFGIMPLF